jgi:hypothetical protein
MRPMRPPGHGLRAALVSLVGVAALLAATVGPVAAKPPSPPVLPALTGFVTDACTGLPISSGLDVAVALIGGDPASPPGPPIKPPSPNFLGLFSYPTLVPGEAYQLTVSAPGYTPLGSDPTQPPGPPNAPGVTLMMPPGPPVLPAGQALATGLLLDIRLQPPGPPTIPGGAPGSACRPPGPPVFPALAGRVVDSTTGRGLRGLVVGVATIDPATGALGAPQRPPGPPTLGFFSYPTLDPGPITLTVSAPGYTALGSDPTKPPTPNGPGVTLMIPPGPPTLPTGQVVNESLVLSVQIPPGPPIVPGG